VLENIDELMAEGVLENEDEMLGEVPLDETNQIGKLFARNITKIFSVTVFTRFGYAKCDLA
jgi:hypothetical protein